MNGYWEQGATETKIQSAPADSVSKLIADVKAEIMHTLYLPPHLVYSLLDTVFLLVLPTLNLYPLTLVAVYLPICILLR